MPRLYSMPLQQRRAGPSLCGQAAATDQAIENPGLYKQMQLCMPQSSSRDDFRRDGGRIAAGKPAPGCPARETAVLQ